MRIHIAIAVALTFGAAPWVAHADAPVVVHPGDVVRLARPDADGCTAGFVIATDRGVRYLLGSGSCLTGMRLNFGADFVRDYGTQGPRVFDVGGRAFGRVRYAVVRTNWASDDTEVALMTLDRGVVADPTVDTIGGPRGVLSAVDSVPRDVVVRGQCDTSPPVQSGVLYRGLPNKYVAPVTTYGCDWDSGGPVLTPDGLAVGQYMVTGAVVAAEDGEPVADGMGRVHRLGPMLDIASAVLGRPVHLVTAA